MSYEMVDDMKTNILKRVRRHFNCGIRHIDRHNRLAWIASVRYLGDKWLLAKPMARKA